MWKIVEKLLVAHFPDFPVTIKQKVFVNFKRKCPF